MRRLLLVLLLGATQEDPAAEAIRRLGSEIAAERDGAAARLKALGEDARPALERAACDGDLEIADRARLMLRALDIRKSLPPVLLQTFPGVEDRLATGDPAWTQFFLVASARDPESD